MDIQIIGGRNVAGRPNAAQQELPAPSLGQCPVARSRGCCLLESRDDPSVNTISVGARCVGLRVWRVRLC